MCLTYWLHQLVIQPSWPCRHWSWVSDLFMRTETNSLSLYFACFGPYPVWIVTGLFIWAFGISLSLKLEPLWGRHVSGGSGQDPRLGPDLCSNPSPTQSRLHCSAQFLGCVIINLHWELFIWGSSKTFGVCFTNVIIVFSRLNPSLLQFLWTCWCFTTWNYSSHPSHHAADINHQWKVWTLPMNCCSHWRH